MDNCCNSPCFFNDPRPCLFLWRNGSQEKRSFYNDQELCCYGYCKHSLGYCWIQPLFWRINRWLYRQSHDTSFFQRCCFGSSLESCSHNSTYIICTVPVNVCDNNTKPGSWCSSRKNTFRFLYIIYCFIQLAGICTHCALDMASRRVFI